MRSGHPRPAAAHAWLGRLFEDQNRMEDAMKEYESALKLDPKNKMAQEGLKRLKRSKSQQRPQEHSVKGQRWISRDDIGGNRRAAGE